MTDTSTTATNTTVWTETLTTATYVTIRTKQSATLFTHHKVKSLTYGTTCSKCHWRNTGKSVLCPGHYPWADTAQMKVNMVIQNFITVPKPWKRGHDHQTNCHPLPIKSTPFPSTHVTRMRTYLWYKSLDRIPTITFPLYFRHLKLNYNNSTGKAIFAHILNFQTHLLWADTGLHFIIMQSLIVKFHMLQDHLTYYSNKIQDHLSLQLEKMPWVAYCYLR